VTAEPYFAVTQPSDVVVMENFVRSDTQGTYENIDAKYELLQRGQYVLNVNPSDIKPFSMDRKTPLEFYEAENAVRIARWTGADQYAAETLQKAELGVQNAQEELSGKIGKKTVAQNSRYAAQNAEDARLITIRKIQDEIDAQAKAEVERRNAETQAEADQAKRAKAEAEETAAQAQAEAERVKRQAELDADRSAQDKAAAVAQAQAEADQRDAQTKAQAEEAQRAKAESEQNAAQAQAEAERVKTQAQADADRAAQDKAAAEEAAAEADRLKRQAQADAERASQEKAAAVAQAQETREQLTQAQQRAEQAEQEKAQLRDQIRQQLNVILVTRETARGLIVNMSDVLFDSGKYTLKPGAREKLAKVSGIILAHPGLNLQIEGHTDSVGSEEYNQRLSEKRANSVRDYLVAQGLPGDSVSAKGLGKTAPVTTNYTPVGRQQNRRVEMVVSGEPIGVTAGNNFEGRGQSYSQR
jgi:outer membrane protein OmpA-like peptidoglycan-associated protein